MIQNSRLSIFLFFFITLLSAAFSANGDSTGASTSCEAIYQSTGNLPGKVLVGTDIVDAATLKPSSDPLEGAYSTDIGGAMLYLSIQAASGMLVVHRKYQEPGEPVLGATYHIACISKGNAYADNLVLRAVQGGVLVAEEKSKLDGIPAHLWIFYNRIDTHRK